MPQAIAPTTIPISDVVPTEVTELPSLEAIRAGRWTDMFGRTDDYPVELLQEAAASYNEVALSGIYQAPILINHSPKEGQKGVLKPTARVEGDRLILDADRVQVPFAADVKAGIWSERSIGLFAPDDPHNPTPGKWNIMELSFVPIPAVNGLAKPRFSATPPEDGRYLSFPNPGLSTESAIAIDSEEQSPAIDLQPIARAIADLQSQVFQLQTSRGFSMTTEAPNTVEAAPVQPDPAIAELRSLVTDLSEKVSGLTTENETLKADNQKLFSAAAIAKREAEELQVNTTLDRLQEEGHISESDRPQHFAFAMSLANEISEEGPKFSIGDQVLSQRALYLKQLGDRPVASRQFSAGKIDIPDGANKGADMTSRRKNRALPTMAN